MTNDQSPMTNQIPKPNHQSRDNDPKFDLVERTARFGEAILAFAKTIPANDITRPLIGQLVRAATSVGANYVEADDANSKKDFRFKVGISQREVKETKHWLRMVSAAEPTLRDTARVLWREAQELNLIFGAIRRKTRT
jgi:four helix bundle protein